MKLLVAVYGSLRKGFGNSGLLKDSVFLGTTDIPGFIMYSLGSFPGIMPDKDKSIFAEVYEITEATLERLDRLEGNPTFYKRELVETPYGQAWVYVLQPQARYENLPVVETGEWGAANARR